MKWVLHVDLDQFIAAVEVLRRPELRGRAVIVGGDGDPSKRGVVSTASYEAREHGVGSGMPLRAAARRSPDAVFLPVDKAAYDTASAEVMAVLRTFDGVVDVLGWDEAFMEVTTGDPEALAQEIRAAVRQRTRLECSIGIGENPLQAKLATGFAKPPVPAGPSKHSGVFRLTAQNWYEVLGDLPTDALWGIGRKTAKRLTEHGITTVRELASADRETLAAGLGPTMGPWYILRARGLDNSEVTGEPWVARSRGHETTFQQNLTDWREVEKEVVRLAHEVARDVAAEARPAARVVVKVRWAPFFTETHGRKLATPTSEPDKLAAAALDLLADFASDRPIRLLGVRAEFGTRRSP